MERRIKEGGLENFAVICFYTPGGNSTENLPLDFSGVCERAICIPLHDLDPSALKKYKMTVDSFFPEADEVARFIYEAKTDGFDVICQCEYGQSRSAACAAAILEHFSKSGIKIFADYRYYPNQLVFHKVFDALNNYRRNIGK